MLNGTKDDTSTEILECNTTHRSRSLDMSIRNLASKTNREIT
jgi:hypothetical protein